MTTQGNLSERYVYADEREFLGRTGNGLSSFVPTVIAKIVRDCASNLAIFREGEPLI